MDNEFASDAFTHRRAGIIIHNKRLIGFVLQFWKLLNDEHCVTIISLHDILF